jgi:multidrug resistance efflux pump
MLAAVHNLNWALGTPGYEEMATAEEQAEHTEACARMDEMLERMAENKRKHDAATKDAERYRKLRSADMETRNRLEHYSDSALDVVLDALPTGVAA